MGEHERIVCEPLIMGGVPTFVGTRIPVATVLNLMAEGVGRRRLLQDYDQLTAADISSALRYAAKNLSPSPSPAFHPNEVAVVEKAITDALAELDKLGQPHAIGCQLACAWGILKGRLTTATTSSSPSLSLEGVRKALQNTFENGNYDAGIGESQHVIYGHQVQTFIEEVMRRLPKQQHTQTTQPVAPAMKYGDVETWTLLANGAFQVPVGMTDDQFMSKLFGWLESFGAAWGGTHKEDPEDPYKAAADSTGVPQDKDGGDK